MRDWLTKGLALKGLVLLAVVGLCANSAQGQAKATGSSKTPQILVRAFKPEGNTLVSTLALQALFERHLLWPIPDGGVRVSPAKLREILEAILNFYLRMGHSGVYVYIPQENIAATEPLAFKNDILKVKIVEGKVREINVKYGVQKKWKPWTPFVKEEEERPRSHDRREAWLQRWNPVEAGNFVQRNQLEDYVEFLERRPGRSAAAVIKKVEGEAAVVPEIGKDIAIEVKVVDADPLSVYTQFNNTGSESTEELRVRLGLFHNNLWGRDDSLAADLHSAASSEFNDNFGAFVSYDAPLWQPLWRGKIYGAYSEFKSADILGPGTPFIGEGYLVGEEISYSLWQRSGWFFDVFNGVEFQNSTVDTPFGFTSDVDLLDVSAGARLERNKGIWRASFEAKAIYNLSDSINLSDREDFSQSRLGSEPSYLVFNLRGQHHLQIMNGVALYQQFGGGFSNDRLIPAREFSVGGLNTVRGYEEFELLGDRGFFISTEPRISLNAFFPKLQNYSTRIDLVPLFFDVGGVFVNDSVQGEDDGTTIYSLGGGGQLFFKDVFFARLYWGYALHDAGDSDENTEKGDNRFHFDLTLRF